MPPRAFLVRHGRTAWSAAGRHTGRTDVALTPEGEEQARALAPALAGHDFALVLTSPLQRARATCRLAGFGDRGVPTPDLAEWDYGRYDGLTSAEIHRQDPSWTLWGRGGPGGELPAQVAARADRVIRLVRGAVGDALLFAHGHILRVLAARWAGLDTGSGRALYLDTGALSVLGWEHDAPVVERWNLSPASGR